MGQRPRPRGCGGRRPARLSPRPGRDGLLGCLAHGAPDAQHRGGAPDRPPRTGSARAPHRGGGRSAGHAAPPRRGAAGHDLRAGSLPRAGGLRPPGGDRARPGRAGLLGSEELHIRVLVARGVRPAARGLAGLRVQAQGPAGEGKALARAPGAGQDLRPRPGPPAQRWSADGERAGRCQEGRTVVGLVRDEDRRRMAARHRRRRLPRAPRLPARLRPGPACSGGRPPGLGMDGRGVRRAAGCCGRALARRGDRSRSGRVPRAAAPARPAGAAVHRPGRGDGRGLDATAPMPTPPR